MAMNIAAVATDAVAVAVSTVENCAAHRPPVDGEDTEERERGDGLFLLVRKR